MSCVCLCLLLFTVRNILYYSTVMFYLTFTEGRCNEVIIQSAVVVISCSCNEVLSLYIFA